MAGTELMNIFSRVNQREIPWDFFFQTWDSSLNNYISNLKTCVLFFWLNVPFYAGSCLASFKSNHKNKTQPTKWRCTVKTISWKQNEIPSVILRVTGHWNRYWSESKIAERATMTKVTGIMQFYECQPHYIWFV